MKFSVLMSIYLKESPAFFNEAMQSIWDEQSVKPNEIVLVKDGKLTNNLDTIIAVWQKKLGTVLQVIELKENVGLGKALNIGIDACRYELIARMDTDDIADRNRFKKQLNIFKEKEIDSCGSWINEFSYYKLQISGTRKVPELHHDILNFAKKRNPMNHPSVMYKKQAVQNAKSYQEMLWFEDYYLWVHMLQNGATFYNIQESLVDMRAGENQLLRRRGKAYFLAEIKFFKSLKNLNFINRWEFWSNIIMRAPTRLIPNFLLKQIYIFLRTD